MYIVGHISIEKMTGVSNFISLLVPILGGGIFGQKWLTQFCPHPMQLWRLAFQVILAPIERQQSNCCLSGKCGFDGGAPPPPQCEVGPAEEGQCLPSVFRRINFLKQNSLVFCLFMMWLVCQVVPLCNSQHLRWNLLKLSCQTFPETEYFLVLVEQQPKGDEVWRLSLPKMSAGQRWHASKSRNCTQWWDHRLYNQETSPNANAAVWQSCTVYGIREGVGAYLSHFSQFWTMHDHDQSQDQESSQFWLRFRFFYSCNVSRTAQSCPLVCPSFEHHQHQSLHCRVQSDPRDVWPFGKFDWVMRLHDLKTKTPSNTLKERPLTFERHFIEWWRIMTWPTKRQWQRHD